MAIVYECNTCSCEKLLGSQQGYRVLRKCPECNDLVSFEKTDRKEFTKYATSSDPTPATTKTSTQELINALQELANELGRTPTSTEFSEHTDYCRKKLSHRVGDWDSVLEKAGLDPTKMHYRRNAIRNDNKSRQPNGAEYYKNDIKAIYLKLGKYPTQNEYDNHSPHSAATVYKYDLTWNGIKAEILSESDNKN